MVNKVYILYSNKLDRFYTGNTELGIEERLEQHNSAYNKDSYTIKGIPWELYLTIECSSRYQARKVELHIKKMKSKKYIQNLKKYSEMKLKLLEKYKEEE